MPKGSNIVDLVGMKFGKLTVVSRAPDGITPKGRKILKWNCVCDCGNNVVKNGESLKHLRGTSCEDCKERPSKLRNLTGQTFGDLTVIELAPPLIMPCGRKQTRWKCKCNCGNDTYVLATHLTRGKIRSCGCKQGKHGVTPNEYVDKGDYYIGYTTKGEEFYFDKDDYEKVKGYRWYIDENGYVAGWNGEEAIRMHQLIIDDECKCVDHKHGKQSRRDNRKYNLRPCTRSENSCNRDKDCRNTTGAKGVFRAKKGRFYASIVKEGITYHLGVYDTIKEAADAYDEAAKKYHGEFACLNNYSGFTECPYNGRDMEWECLR